MMLRSSSTPLLGSLLSSSSYSESPNHKDYETSSEVLRKISFTHGGNGNGSLNFSSFTTSSNNSTSLTRSISGISDSSDREVSSTTSSKGFRRAQSDGNLKGLCDMEEQDLFSHFATNPFKPAKRTSMLQSIPSFSVYNSKGGFEDDDEGEEEEDYEDEIEKDGSLQRCVTIGDNITSMGNGEKMGLIQENEEEFNEFQYLGLHDDDNPSLFLARGLGIDGNGGGGGFNFAKFGEGGVENEEEIGKYYKKMVEEHPSSSLFLRNYAKFLYKPIEFRFQANSLNDSHTSLSFVRTNLLKLASI
ncbi:hypothetical protein MKW94_030150, partial [Papaver nudicaule]|nr:hypothetical protein [Papaver nudicaule]